MLTSILVVYEANKILCAFPDTADGITEAYQMLRTNPDAVLATVDFDDSTLPECAQRALRDMEPE